MHPDNVVYKIFATQKSLVIIKIVKYIYMSNFILKTQFPLTSKSATQFFSPMSGPGEVHDGFNI